MSEVLLKITGDSGGASRAVQDTQERYERASQKAKQITQDLQTQHERAAQARLQLDRATSVAETRQAERRLETQVAALQRLERAHETAQQRIAQTERQLTRTVEDESRKQGAARMNALKGGAGAFVGGLGGGPVGSLAGGLIAGANPAMAAGAAAAAGVNALRDGVEEANAWARAVREMGVASGGSAPQVSTLMAVVERFGIPVDALRSSMEKLRENMLEHPEHFAALGIETKNLDGTTRKVIDVFMELRELLAAAPHDARTMQVAEETLGQSSEDLRRFLFATNEEIARTKAEAQATSKVINEEAINATERWDESTRRLGDRWATFTGDIVQRSIPMLTALVDALDSAAGAASRVLPYIPFIGPIASLLGVGSGSAPAAAPFVQRGRPRGEDLLPSDPLILPTREDSKPPPKVSGGGGGGPSPRDSVADAIREHIELIRESTAARQEQLRQALAADQKQRASTIDALEGARTAAGRAHAERVEQLRDEQREADRVARATVRRLQDELKSRERAREVALEAIAAERAALESAFAEREAQRAREAAAVEAQMRALEERDQAEQDRKAIAEAEGAIEELSQQDLTRIRSEALSDHAERVAEHDRALAQARDELARIHTEIAEREVREGLQLKLEGIAQASAADRGALDQEAAALDTRIEAIRRQSAADRDATAERIEGLNREREAQREATELRLEELQREHKQMDEIYGGAITRLRELKDESKLAADAQIEDLRRIGQEAVDSLQKQLAARQAGAGAGDKNAGGSVFLKWAGVSVSSQEYARALEAEAAGGVHSWSFLTAPGARNDPRYAGFLGVPKFALGGAITLTEPAAMIGLNSGRALAIAGEAGPEDVWFGGGVGRGSRGPIVVENNQPIVLNGREVGRHVSRYIADQYSLRGGRRRH